MQTKVPWLKVNQGLFHDLFWTKRGKQEVAVEKKHMSTYSFNQKDAPLFENFWAYAKKGIAAFHTPGHRGGRGCERLFRRLGGPLLRMDLTELKGANLEQDPDFLQTKAEELAADAFGAHKSYFLVNGASSGIMAACLALRAAGQEILVARNCHLSVVNGIILAGLKPVFLPPAWIEGLPCLPATAVVRDYLERYPQAAGIFLTNPGYHGIYGPLAEIAALCKARRLPLLVDEAHGGHLRFIDPGLAEAGSVTADLWVWGVHKLMGSLTQTGMLHIGPDFPFQAQLEEALQFLSSTSPSYLLLASLDSTRRQLYFKGRRMFRRAAQLGSFVREQIKDLPGLKLIEPSALPAGYGLDPTKIILSLRPAGWPGLDAETVLRRRYRVQPEYADRDYLYFFISYAQKKKDLSRLVKALRHLAGTAGPTPGEKTVGPPPWNHRPLAISPRTAVDRPSVYLDLPDAAGRIAAGLVAAYPPGIPLWIPGEEITPAMVEWITAFQQQGGYVRGLKNGQVKVSSI